jgi:hypothetical protein
MKPSQARPSQQGSLPHARSLSGTGLRAKVALVHQESRTNTVFAMCAQLSARTSHQVPWMYANMAVLTTV